MTDRRSHIETARRVIVDEAQALTVLADSLGASFDDCVAAIRGAEGRVIVSGMGKSGHIARKIAATLASTGTPAHFVHPAEASHGDLGMIGKNDVVIAISNSGEAPELANLVAYTRRYGITLVGITSRAESTLGTQADLALLIPGLGEACGYGIVPTTSTTMTLALGDALAIALMQDRGFTPENFRDFHPGGKLGSRLARVRDLMHKGQAIPLVSRGTMMDQALLTISQKGFGVVGVTENAGRLCGIVTDGDLRRHMDGLLSLNVDQVMTANPRTIAADALAEEAVSVMNERKITCLFVVDVAKPDIVAGIIHIHDCLRAGVV